MSKVIEIKYQFDEDKKLEEHLKCMRAGEGYQDLLIDIKNKISKARASNCDKKTAIDFIAEIVEDDKYGYGYNDE